MSALEQLQQVSTDLLFSTQAHLIGFAALQIEDVDSLGAVLNDKERKLLELYDRFDRLSLEKAELEAAKTENSPSPSPDTLAKDLTTARANLQLKRTVITATLIAQPILSAIHREPSATAKESHLLPLLTRRDTLSLTHANLSHALTQTLSDLTETQRATAAVRAENTQLAASLLTAARHRDAALRRNPPDPAAESAAAAARRESLAARAVVQAVITSSGVDWAREPRWRALVLACADDDDA